MIEAQTPDPSLVAAYSFDEAAEGVLVDVSGKGNNGNITGALWTTGRYGSALSFDGIDDWVTVPDSTSLDLTTAMTMAAWVRPSATLTGYHTVLMKERAGNLAYTLYANGSGNVPSAEVTISTPRALKGTNSVVPGQWTHLAATYDGATLKFFVNGIQVRTLSVSGSIFVSGNPLRLGGNAIWSDEFFNGLIDEVRIYNRALTTTEIQNVMNTPLTPGGPADTAPPTVAISAPAGGSTVSGNVSVMAQASDNAGLAGVQFKVDGNDLGAEDTTAPYEVAWNTTATSGGPHTLTAIARDTAGNTASASSQVTVDNSGVPPIDPALVAAYSFDEAAGSVLVDVSGKGNNGSITGALWAAGRYGSALSFDGIDDWVTVPDSTSLDLSTAMTMAAWVKPSATLSGYHTVLMKERPGNLVYTLYANGSGNVPSAEITISNPRAVKGTSRVPTTQWTHLAATYDGATLKFFVNGIQVRTLNVSGSIFVSGQPLRLGGNAIWSDEFFHGLIDEVRIYNRALTATELQNVMNTPLTTGGTDTEAPVVAISAPAGGATVSGNVSVTAQATDNVGVAGVQFKVDGNDLGAEDTTAPYEVAWNTTATTAGPHTLTAIARDIAGNTAAAPPITVTVAVVADPRSVAGEWGPVHNLGHVAVHATLLRSGKILTWAGWERTSTRTYLWDPVTLVRTDTSLLSQIFCSAHVYLPDGRLLVVGGHDGGNTGTNDASIFDPVSEQWLRIDDMSFARWYPGAVTLADGRVVSISGQITPDVWAENPEIYNPATDSWSTLTAGPGFILHDKEYALSFLQPDGRIYVLGATPGVQALLNADTGAWTNLGPISTRGTAATIGPGLVMYTGGGDAGGGAEDCLSCQSVNQASIIDFNVQPQWRSTASMTYPRYEHNLVVLPDGDVLAVGGIRNLDKRSNDGVLVPEVWDRTTETWSQLAPMAQPRSYHSVALLLPDARVYLAGGGEVGGGINYPTAEIFSPPYLFKGPRPAITGVNGTATYGETFTVNTPDAATIASVALVGLGSVTHTIDMNQHFVNLPFSASGTSLTLTLPENANVIPPGDYMLFLVNAEGVPSVAHMLRVSSGGSGPPPSVTIIAPADGSTVTGTVIVRAGASSTAGVAGVQFKVDGNDLGAEDTTAPYEVAWNTTATSGGPHTLTAIARDTAGNTASASIQVTVDNSGVPPIDPALVAAYSFDEAAGSVLVDVSGKGNNGSITGALWTQGRYGSALSFDGIDDWVTVPDSTSLDLTTAMTMAAWVKPSATLTGYHTVLMKERPGNLVYTLYANGSGNLPSAEVTISSPRVVKGTTSVASGQWTHLAATYDGATLRLYVNGVQVRTLSVTGSIIVSGQPLRLGGNAIWSDEFFNGLIDEVRIYNRVLTATEIQSAMNTPLVP